MIDKLLINYLKNCQSLSQATSDAMWKQWRWWFAPCQFGFSMMDTFLMDSRALTPIADRPQTPVRETPRVEAVGSQTESRPDNLKQRAMERLQSGHAPPREIYDVRNRDQIDWSKVPDWAKAVDPELFEGAHEG